MQIKNLPWISRNKQRKYDGELTGSVSCLEDITSKQRNLSQFKLLDYIALSQKPVNMENQEARKK